MLRKAEMLPGSLNKGSMNTPVTISTLFFKPKEIKAHNHDSVLLRQLITNFSSFLLSGTKEIKIAECSTSLIFHEVSL